MAFSSCTAKFALLYNYWRCWHQTTKKPTRTHTNHKETSLITPTPSLSVPHHTHFHSSSILFIPNIHLEILPNSPLWNKPFLPGVPPSGYRFPDYVVLIHLNSWPRSSVRLINFTSLLGSTSIWPLWNRRSPTTAVCFDMSWQLMIQSLRVGFYIHQKPEQVKQGIVHRYILLGLCS